MDSRNCSAQGALEYLLLVGGAVLIAGVILGVMISAQSASQRNALRNSIIAQDASDASLVAHYNFDEGAGKVAEDSSIYRNHARYCAIADSVCSASTAVQPMAPNDWIAGKNGLAMNFNQAYYAFAEEKPQLSLEDGSFSIAFWMRQNTLDESHASVVTKKGSSNTYARNYRVGRIGDATWFAFLAGEDGGAGPFTITPSWPNSPPTSTVWEQRAVVVSPGSVVNTVKVQLYTNGSLAQTYVDIPPIPKNVAKEGLYIATTQLGGGPRFHFPGAVDDLRVYNRSLSADEIKRLYDAFK